MARKTGSYNKRQVLNEEVLIREYRDEHIPTYKIAEMHDWSLGTIIYRLKKLGLYNGDTRIGRKYVTKKRIAQSKKEEEQVAKGQEVVNENTADIINKALAASNNRFAEQWKQRTEQEIKDADEFIASLL